MAELRTQPPTPRRRREARRAGDVAQSPLLGVVAVAAGLVLWLAVGGASLADALVGLARRCFAAPVLPPAALTQRLEAAGESVLGPLAGFFAVVGALAVLMTVAQVGFVVAPGLLRPRLDRLGPAAGWQGLRQPERWTAALMGGLAAVALVAVTSGLLASQLPTLARMPAAGLGRGLQAALVLATRWAAWAIATLGLLGLVDLAWRRHWRGQRLRMTRTEVEEELRQTEGDPVQRAQRKRLHAELASFDLGRAVGRATVVVTAPTGEAAALFYDPALLEAPQLTARGRGPVAERLLALALAAGVPIREAPALSAALTRLPLGATLPMSLWPDAAAVLGALPPR